MAQKLANMLSRHIGGFFSTISALSYHRGVEIRRERAASVLRSANALQGGRQRLNDIIDNFAPETYFMRNLKLILGNKIIIII